MSSCKKTEKKLKERPSKKERGKSKWSPSEDFNRSAAKASSRKASKKSKKKKRRQTEPAKCHLLELAAELRDMIYEYTLTDECYISLYPDNRDLPKRCLIMPYEEPGLLSTCHQIRDEALPIYYKSNEFEAQISGKLSTKLMELEMKCKALGVLDDMIMNVCPREPPDWERTMQWCEHIQSGGKWYLEEWRVVEIDHNAIFYCAAVEMAKGFIGVDWQICKHFLDILGETKEKVDEDPEERFLKLV